MILLVRGVFGGIRLYTQLFRVLFAVAETCPRLCSNSRDSSIVSERELSQFVRKLMRFVYAASVIPAEFEVNALLRPLEDDYVAVDDSLYKSLFGQYFRYDVRTQLPYFYRSVQKLLGALCRDVAGTWQCGTLDHFSLTPFDPVPIHGGSADRCIVALVGMCAVLSRYNLVDDSSATTILRQYREVTQFLKKKWALTESAPVVDDVVVLRLSYPYWSRCRELLAVIHLLFGFSVDGSYEPDFVDEVKVAMPVDTSRSSLHFVRSGFANSFAGHSQRTLTGLLRVCETSDMQVSCLSNESRSRPWDQLLKSGLGEALSRSNAVLSNELVGPSATLVDDYRSNISAQLDLVDCSPTAGRRSGPSCVCVTKAKKIALRQSDVILGATCSTPVQSARKSKKATPKDIQGPSFGPSAVIRSGERSQRSRGRCTGGVPGGRKCLQLANVSDDVHDSSSEDIVAGVGKKRQSRFNLDSSDEQSQSQIKLFWT